MGTSLTGLTPATTYDALIKVGDNGPLSGTLKKLSDGLGNDSSLSLSTTAASFSGTLSISGDAVGSKFYTAGSAVPTAAVSVFLNANYGGPAYNNSSFVTGNGATGVMMGGDTASYTYGWIQGVQTDNGNAKGLVLQPISGNVGIGTTSPSAKLHVSSGYTLVNNAYSFAVNNSAGSAFAAQFGAAADVGFVSGGNNAIITAAGANAILLGTNNVERVRVDADGLKFNGDTAAANALDDYEEGTFTPVLSDGTNNATMDANTLGFYTKIGRVVYCSFTVSTSSLGSVSGDIEVKGLPFLQGGTFGPSAFTTSANQLLNVSLGQFVSGRILGAATSIQLWINNSTAGMTRMQATEWSSDGYANFTGYYFV